MKKFNLLTVVGARPQFVKAAVISRLINSNYPNFEEVMVHTGQHFDKNMSDIFFNELEISQPKYALNINNLNHGEMIGRMVIELEKIYLQESPDCVIAYGDTNSTLAGALAAKKLNIPIAHIEAGVRTYDEGMPEESNRYLVDRMSALNFCCTDLGYANLINEGYKTKALDKLIYLSGDLMLEAANYESKKNKAPSMICKKILQNFKNYILVTIHRPSNTDKYETLSSIVNDLNKINKEKDIILLTHPRTKAKLEQFKLKTDFLLYEPLGYFDTLKLLQSSSMVITDSGGLVREAYFFNKKSLFLLIDHVWPELASSKASINTAPSPNAIYKKYKSIDAKEIDFSKKLFGDGNAGSQILDSILQYLDS